jgi:hypothetical protein
MAGLVPAIQAWQRMLDAQSLSRKHQRRDFSFANQAYFSSAALGLLVSKFQDRNCYAPAPKPKRRK